MAIWYFSSRYNVGVENIALILVVSVKKPWIGGVAAGPENIFFGGGKELMVKGRLEMTDLCSISIHKCVGDYE